MSGIQSPSTLTFYLYHLEIGPTLGVDSTPPRRIIVEAKGKITETPGLFDRLVAFADSDTLSTLQSIEAPLKFMRHLTACSLMIHPLALPKNLILAAPHVYNPELGLSILIKNATVENFHPSLFLLSYLHLNGIGVDQNLGYSASLIKEASSYPPAMYAFAYGLYNGVHGFAHDEKLSKDWMYRAKTKEAIAAQGILSQNPDAPVDSLPFPYPQPLKQKDVMELDPHSPAEMAFHEKILARMDEMAAEIKALREQNALLLTLVQNPTTQRPQ